LLALAQDILHGNIPDIATYRDLAGIPERDAFTLLPGADLIRNRFFGREVHLCAICNGKSGRCSEDCAFCSQSVHANSDIPIYPLLKKKDIQEGARYASQAAIHRYSVVTSGKRLPRQEVAAVAEAFAEVNVEGVGYCASLGILDREDLDILKKAGVTRYHHNLETAESHFHALCSTHSYAERVSTVRTAKEIGLSVCSGGLFGVGESDTQVLELALALRDLDVDAVPINFLVPIAGTRLEKAPGLSPLRCLKIIALFRFVLPEKDILICGGREANLRELHPLVLYAGASGIMTGNYLTTRGRSPEADLGMLDQLEFTLRAPFSRPV
jgi:biotin synthase